MNRDIIKIPRSLYKPQNTNWDIDWRGQSSGEGNDGTSQFVVNAFPRWVGSPQLLLSDDDIGRWRAVRARVRGRVGLYEVEMNDPAVFPDCGPVGGVPFATGQTFAGGSGFAYNPVVLCEGGFARGAQAIVVRSSQSPKPGQIMSHNKWPFQVVDVTKESADVYALSIEMALRDAIPDGDEISLMAVGLFETTDARAGNPEYGLDYESRPKLSLQEYLSR